MPLNLTAAVDDNGRRLDRILRKALRELPLSAVHRLLRQGSVCVNGEKASAGRRVSTGETITVELDQNSLPQSCRTSKKDHTQISHSILFEGAGLLILNKPSGLVVHGRESLEEQVRSYLEPKLPPSLSFRPGPLHRLDKLSSGAIVFSASLEGARLFSMLMRDRRIKKSYLAVVEGVIKNPELWKDELIRDRREKKTFIARHEPGKSAHDADSKTASTRVKPLAAGSSFTLILAEIETGRTHQIRAQAAAHGHPLAGDRKYGGQSLPRDRSAHDPSCPDFLLHAWRMEFPAGASLPGLIEAPLPGYFQKKTEELFGRTEIFPPCPL